MSKVLVISDIHHRYEMFSNKLQKLFNPDLTIFLGDYFDSNTETAKQIEKTASQLKWSLLQKNRIHLIGNHDSYYASQGKRFFRTTKSFRWKQDIIDQYINENVWLSCFKFTHIIDNIIFSHAGLSNHWFPQSICYELNYKENVSNYIQNKNNECISSLKTGMEHPCLDISVIRGGTAMPGYGGCTWMDWSEFNVIPNFIQIVGHSKDNNVRIKKLDNNSFNVCMDTKNKHLMMIDTITKEFIVYEFNGNFKTIGKSYNILTAI